MSQCILCLNCLWKKTISSLFNSHMLNIWQPIFASLSIFNRHHLSYHNSSPADAPRRFAHANDPNTWPWPFQGEANVSEAGWKHSKLEVMDENVGYRILNINEYVFNNISSYCNRVWWITWNAFAHLCSASSWRKHVWHSKSYPFCQCNVNVNASNHELLHKA